MKILEPQPKLVEQVHKAILEEISGGRLRPGSRIIQEQVAKELEQPRNVWGQHEAMLDAMAAGDAQKAEELGRQHILQAAEFMIRRLEENGTADEEGQEGA